MRGIGNTLRKIKTDPIFKKTGHRDINNLWTGWEYGAKGKAIAGAGLLGGAAIMVPTSPARANSNLVKRNVEAQSDEQDIESMISTRGDMQGYLGASSMDPNLSASGDLVFAMHKTRHTGQL